MRTDLAEKVVFITGASGGIGRATAELLAEEGAYVALQAHTQNEALEEWVAAKPWREQALLLSADVRESNEVDAAFQDTLAAWHRVDVCVVNAGIWPGQELHLHQMSEKRVLDTLEVNLLGAMWTAKSFLGALANSGPHPDGHGASLIFVGSTAGRFGEAEHVDYSVSKAGMYGLVRTLKNEIVVLDPFGRVNMVEPGWTATPMAGNTPQNDAMVKHITRTMALRQIARAEDIARTIGYLASPYLSRHVSGEVITVAGGMEGRSLWSDFEIHPDEVRLRLDPDL